MQLYIVRHAEAVDVGEAGVQTDEARFLTARGVEQSRRVGRLFRDLRIPVDGLWTSPLIRARQTAEHLASELASPLEPVETAELAPPGQLGQLLGRADASGAAHLIVVGHEPYLGELLRRLATGSATGTMPMSKASVACIDFRGPTASRLVWLLPNPTIHALRATD